MSDTVYQNRSLFSSLPEEAQEYLKESATFHGKWTRPRIARAFGISPQRLDQILKKEVANNA